MRNRTGGGGRPVGGSDVYIAPVKEPYIGRETGPNGLSWSDLLTTNGLRFGAETQAALAEAFRFDGYQISSDPTGTDATVEADVETPLYVANPWFAGGACTPLVVFDVSMKKSNRHSTVFRHKYYFKVSTHEGVEGGIRLPADQKYEVKDCVILWSNPQLPIEAFRSGIAELKTAVASEVKKQP